MRPLAAFVALALAAVALSACGGEDAKLLPGATAGEISENLDTVKQLVSEGECIGAENAAEDISTQVEALEGVDPKLKQALQRGAARLGEVVAACEEEEAEAVAPADEATEVEETTKLPPGQARKAEKEAEKEAKKLEHDEAKQEEKLPPQTPTTPTETTPAEPPTSPPPTEGGGTGAPGGVSPGAPVGEGE